MVKGLGRQPIGGKSPDACPSCDRKHRPGKCPLRQARVAPSPVKCEICGKQAKKNMSLCGPCSKQSKKASQVSRKKAKPNQERKKAKAEKKRFGWSKTSTIQVKGVAKNRWRPTYKGPRVRHENYLMEKTDDE